LNHQNFSLHLWGTTGLAKSIALDSAISIWGAPKILCKSFNSTAVGLEKCAGFLKNLPLGITERETLKIDKAACLTLIYNLTEGISAAKGKRDGGMQHQFNWNLVTLTNGEGLFLSENAKPGARCRTIELFCNHNIFEDPSMVENFVCENYGGVGKLWIQTLQQEIQKTNEVSLKDQYEVFHNTLTRKNIMDRIVQIAAVLAFADYLSGVHIFGVDKDLAMESAMKFGQEILGCVPTKDEVNISARAWDWTLSWLAQNENKLNKNRSGERIGQKEGDTFYVISRIYNEEFTAEFNLDVKPVIREFVKQGHILEHNQNEKHLSQVTKRIGGTPVKCYQFLIPLDDVN